MEKPNSLRVQHEAWLKNKAKAMQLFKEGWSYRQIAKKLGYKSHYSITEFIKGRNKK